MPSKYSQEDIDRALLAFWLEGENITRAAERTGFAKQRISEWVKEHRPERYNQIVELHAPELDKTILRKQEAIVLNALDAVQELIEQTMDLARAGKLRSPDQALQRIATAMGITADKWLVMQGRPNQISQPADVQDILRKLERNVPWFVKNEAETEPIEDAQPVLLNANATDTKD